MSRRTIRGSTCRCSPPAGPSGPTWTSGYGTASAISPRPPGSGWASPPRAETASSRNCSDEENSKSEIRNPKSEVIVVNDRSTDGTGGILEELARADPRLRVVSGSEPPPGWIGKPHALWLGARPAGGELLLFADADVRYQPTSLREAVRLLE